MSDTPEQQQRFAVATLGCKVNQFETADMVQQLLSNGWQQVPFGQPAELCLINSCTVTARSDAESRRLVRRARRAAPEARVVVTGCYAQVAPQELQGLPDVDLVLGNEEKQTLLLQLQQGRHQVSDLSSLKGSGPLRLTSFAEHTRAFLQVQNGCEACCSYCIVPTARGPSRSAHPQDALQAVSRLAQNGFQEVVLTGIHLGAYGLDLTPVTSLTKLVELLDQRQAVPRLRLGSIEPNELTDDLLALFCSSPLLCPHLHIPLQSGADSVLQRMGRQYDTAFYERRIRQAHHLLPDAFIAADLIAGFPSESETEFQETCSLLEALPLSDLHVFPYSRRPGTRAADMPGHLPPALIKARAEQLRSIAARKRTVFQQRCLGTTLQVLGQRHNAATGMMTGLSRNYAEVSYPAPVSLLNHEVTVLAERLENGMLLGRAVEGTAPA